MWRRDNDAFPIPMRGNELVDELVVDLDREVPDPHEG